MNTVTIGSSKFLSILATSCIVMFCAAPGLCTEQYRTAKRSEPYMGLVSQWGPTGSAPKLVVLALHGMAMHGGAFERFGKEMAARHVMVVAPDLPGYGQQCRRSARRCIFSAKQSLDMIRKLRVSLKQRYPGVPLVLLGESLGGALAIQSAVSFPENLDGLVLSAPALELNRSLELRLLPRLLISTIALKEKVALSSLIRHYSTNQDTEGAEVLADPDTRTTTTLKELLRIRKVLSESKESAAKLPVSLPILVIHGSADRVIRPAGSQDIFKTVAGGLHTVDFICGAGHLLLEVQRPRENVIATISNWLGQHTYASGQSPNNSGDTDYGMASNVSVSTKLSTCRQATKADAG